MESTLVEQKVETNTHFVSATYYSECIPCKQQSTSHFEAIAARVSALLPTQSHNLMVFHTFDIAKAQARP